MYNGGARDQNLRVLIVENSSVHGSNLWLLVSELGHHAQWVTDGDSAIRAASLFEPQVVLMNVVLTGIAASDAAARIRALSSPYLLKVVGIGNECAASMDSVVAGPLDKRALRTLFKSAVRPSKALSRSPKEDHAAA